MAHKSIAVRALESVAFICQGDGGVRTCVVNNDSFFPSPLWCHYPAQLREQNIYAPAKEQHLTHALSMRNIV